MARVIFGRNGLRSKYHGDMKNMLLYFDNIIIMQAELCENVQSAAPRTVAGKIIIIRCAFIPVRTKFKTNRDRSKVYRRLRSIHARNVITSIAL